MSQTPGTFLMPHIMEGRDWRGLELAVTRLLLHSGWRDVQDVGQSGDKGADILAVRQTKSNPTGETYLFQVKSVSGSSYVGQSAINEAIAAQGHYGAKIVVVVTNGEFRKSAIKRRDELRASGFDVRLWNGTFVNELLAKWPDYAPSRRDPREYQQGIVDSILSGYDDGRTKSLFIVATGLGKTVIAATAVDALMKKGLKRVLVLCHSVDLIQQLQQAFWTQISKTVPTRLFMDGQPPVPIDGINFGLYQTLFGYLGGVEPDAFDLIVVDEAHHALANAFVTCIDHLTPKHLIGMTATPWRGDGATLDTVFGEPIAKVSLIEGMRMGYLAKVDYRLMCDNIDWKAVPTLTQNPTSVRDLNKHLFIPQRDDEIIKHLLDTIASMPKPRIAVFSPSKKHAEEFARKLNANRVPAANASIDDKVARRRILMDFSAGHLKAITAVDVLNEGIDVPDVNVLVFLRATHSRRIFVQQLGRGLRIAPGKDKVIVLDFVTDIRRMAAVAALDKEAKNGRRMGDAETVYLRDGVVAFNDERTQRFVDAWLDDVADLQDADDAETLTFPMELI